MQTRPTGTLPALRAPWWSISSTSPDSMHEGFSRPEARKCSASRACLESCRNSPWIGMKYRGRTRFSTSFISSMLACPETCTGGFMLPYSTSAPRRDMWSIMRKMAFSLPGMMRGAQHDRVACFHRDVFMVVHGHARQSRHGLALRARDEYRHLLRERPMASWGRIRPRREYRAAERVGDFADGCHTPSRQ